MGSLLSQRVHVREGMVTAVAWTVVAGVGGAAWSCLDGSGMSWGQKQGQVIALKVYLSDIRPPARTYIPEAHNPEQHYQLGTRCHLSLWGHYIKP